MPVNTWFQSAEERQEHIDMIRDQKKWPWADFLQVKHPERMNERVSMHDTRPAHGRIWSEGGTVVHFDDGSKEHYSSVEELVDAGWVVD